MLQAARRKWVFAFDLDGTITGAELLPRMASAVGLEEEMARLTRLTLDGSIPFAESFRQRFSMLRRAPLETLRRISATVPVDPCIQDFIAARPDECFVVTGNLDIWIEPLVQRLGCPVFCSRSESRDDGLHLVRVLEKGEVIRELKKGRKVATVGESVSDVPMFKEADLAVAFAGVHTPVPALGEFSAYCAATGRELCSFLRRLTKR